VPARRKIVKIATSARSDPGPAPPLPNWQGLLTPVVAHAFSELGISVSLWLSGDWWHPIHLEPSVTAFEYDHGVASRRFAYNFRSFAQVKREQKTVRAEHAGFFDLFVPVQDGAEIRAIFVAGPFATSRPTSAQLLQRWRAVAGSHGRLTDPSFSQYVTATLDTLTLEGSMLGDFERLLWCFAGLVVGGGNPTALAREAETLRHKLSEARAPERMWDAARSMTDERTARSWPWHAHQTLARLGMKRGPQHVVVGLMVGRKNEPDPVDDLLRRNAFQRVCVVLSRQMGDVVCGQIGDHGVVFLADYAGSSTRTRARLNDVAMRARSAARRFGLELHAGITQASEGRAADLADSDARALDAARLPLRYRAALSAAEKALSQGLAIVHGEPRPERSAKQLRRLRSKLAESIGERHGLLSPRFNQYIEAILVHCGYRLEPVRAHLEAGLERLAEPLLATGSLDEKSFDELCSSVEREAQQAQTVMALVDPYRRVVSDIESAIAGPTQARQDRGTRRALTFIRDHLREPLTLAQVARAAGFAPDYFSRLFRRNEGMTFEHYTQKVRVERAKQVLDETSLSVDGVRQLCGFHTRNYFHKVFREAVGLTPIEYRERAG
jgi:AraC-like DNA-binding protein